MGFFTKLVTLMDETKQREMYVEMYDVYFLRNAEKELCLKWEAMLADGYISCTETIENLSKGPCSGLYAEEFVKKAAEYLQKQARK